MKALLTGALLSTLLALPALAETVWIDVRSYPEHLVDNIEGDPRIDHGDIVEEVSERYPDKGTDIKLYCAAGGRAGTAAQALLDAGYTSVENAGGIDDARRARGIED